jgi:hypothetical protein
MAWRTITSFFKRATHLELALGAAIFGILCLGLALVFGQSISLAPSTAERSAPSPDHAKPLLAIPATSPSPTAIVEINGVTQKIVPNSIHEYPRLTVPAETRIPVQIKVSPDDVVEVTALDGGNFDNKSIFQSQIAGSSGSVDFGFRVKASPGSYRVAVERNGERNVLIFG